MANTLTNLIADAYVSLDIVSRELTGLIPSVAMDAEASRAAVGQTVRSHVAPAADAEDITPATNPPDTGDQTIGNKTITITKARAVPFRWTGEEQRSVTHSGGPGYRGIRNDQLTQAIRTLANEVEADLAALYNGFSRAYGTAGTTPFASSLDGTAEILRILKDNGAPGSDLQLVIDTAAGAKMRTLGQLTKANEAGGASLLRQGVLMDVHGMAIRESAQIKQHTKGTADANYLVDLVAGYAVKSTTLHLDTGAGTHVAGDVLTFAGGTDKYVVTTGDAGSGDKDIVLSAPGLRVALANNDTVAAPAANYRANMAFHRNAIVLAARLPALPEEGDAADDREVIVDPRSGLAFEIAVYRQYRRVRYEIALAWGVSLIKPEHTALLLG